MVVLMSVCVVVIVDVLVVLDEMGVERHVWVTPMSAAPLPVFITTRHGFGSHESLCSCDRVGGSAGFTAVRPTREMKQRTLKSV